MCVGIDQIMLKTYGCLSVESPFRPLNPTGRYKPFLVCEELEKEGVNIAITMKELQTHKIT